jgi:hypothetical protein
MVLSACGPITATFSLVLEQGHRLVREPPGQVVALARHRGDHHRVLGDVRVVEEAEGELDPGEPGEADRGLEGTGVDVVKLARADRGRGHVLPRLVTA